MLFRLITFLLIGWFLSRILFRFILPIFRVSSAAHSHMRNMQEQMRNMEQQMNGNTNNVNTQQSRPKVEKQGDYIDYEEVK